MERRLQQGVYKKKRKKKEDDDVVVGGASGDVLNHKLWRKRDLSFICILI